MCVWFTMYDVYIHTHIHDPWSCSMHECMILDPDVCMYDAYIIDPDTSGHDAHMYDAFIHDAWSWYMRVWCTKQWSWPLILKRVCMHDASMYDSGPWSWMYDACNNASFSRICVYMMLPDACMHDAYIYYSWPFTLMHVCMMHRCMMHNAQIYDSVPWSWWCMNLGRCMYIWCGTFWGPTNGRTDEQGDSRSRMWNTLRLSAAPPSSSPLRWCHYYRHWIHHQSHQQNINGCKRYLLLAGWLQCWWLQC